MPNQTTQRGNVFLVILIVVAVLGVSAFLLYNAGSNRNFFPTANPNSTGKQDQNSTSTDSAPSYNFETPKKSAHYETNTPEHASVLAGVPVNVVIDFNFDLAAPSSISVMKDGKEYGVGETVIDQNKLAMRRNLDPNAPDGLYTVTYNACWPDKSCHDGTFQFAIDRTRASTFLQMTNQKEVTIAIAGNSFEMPEVKVARGSKVTWINYDTAEHYINTDSHPAHTYYPSQNSNALRKGDSYSLTFIMPGIYPYHCSAHESSMKGMILVE